MAEAALKHSFSPARRITSARALRPTSIEELQQCIDPGVRVPFPLRPRGGSTSSTDCNSSPGGLVIEMSGLNQVVDIDIHNYQVTVEAGVRLQDLLLVLDEQGLELPGCYDLYRHTVGGAVAAPCFGPGVGEDASALSRQIVSMQVVTAGGELVTIAADDNRLMPLFRCSYGLLGVIATVTLRVRPRQVFSVSYKRLRHTAFFDSLGTLATLPIGLKFYLMPYRDRVYLEIMRHNNDEDSIHDRAWRARDWGESTVLPHVFRSIQRVVPTRSLQYRVIDSINSMAQDMGHNRLLRTSNYTLKSGHRQSGERSRTANYSTWCFPAVEAAKVCAAVVEFSRRLLRDQQFRCDLPVVGFRVAQDHSALMSPSRTQAMIALQFGSSSLEGWEDFVIDLADFAASWGGVPLFNQTRSADVETVQSAYGAELRRFIGIRRQLDPDDRLLNPFLAQYFC